MKRLILIVGASVASTVLLTAGLAAPAAFANTGAPPGPPQFFSGVNPGCPDAVTSSGNATTVNPNAAQLTSVCYGYGGVNVNFPAATTFSQLTDLSTNYTMTQGTCGGGAPRFEVDLTDGDFFTVYFGTPPYGGCLANTFSSTSAVSNGISSAGWFVDYSNTPETYAQVEATYGSQALADVQIIEDAGWSQPPNYAQQVLIQNWNVNGTSFFSVNQPTSTAQCKNGGWQNYTDANGTSFKNQGDCVSYVATGGSNLAAG
jgi:hypothetical protein